MTTKLGFTNKEIIETASARTIEELIAALESFVASTTNDASLIYIESGDADTVTARLIENTLTDGSKTYDVRIS